MTIKNQLENQENEKTENYLTLKNWLSQKKNYQKARIYLNLTLKRLDQTF